MQEVARYNPVTPRIVEKLKGIVGAKHVSLLEKHIGR